MISFAGMLGDWLSSSVGNGVPGILDIGIRSLAFSIATFIYKLIISFYNIFEKLCSGRFFDSSMLKDFSERIGVILGVVMLFITIFSMIKMVVDPEKVSDKEIGATVLIKKIIIVIVLLGVSNFVFSFLYKVQDIVLEEDIISKILLPIRINEERSADFGNVLAEELFMSFYQIEENIAETEDYGYCQNVIWQFRDQIITSGNFNLGRECLSEHVKVNSGGGVIETFLINYNWLLSLVAGAVVAYLLFSYCISVGIRMIQLLFLEIISPMAIISYMVPKKDTMFGKWGKIYIATYIDVFIRVAIIDFIVFIIATIFSSNISFINDIKDDKGIVTAILIIALLTFAKKAPDLLKELFPASASKLGLGMKSPKQIFDGMLGGNIVKAGAKMATVGAAIGLGSAALSGMSRYKINMKNGKSRTDALLGAAGGAFMAYGRGLKAGAVAKGNVFKSVGEGFKSQRTIDDKYDELITSGGSTMGAFRAKLSSFAGETLGQTYTRQVGYMDKLDSFKKDVQSYADEIGFVKSAKSAWENIKQRDNESLEDFRKRKDDAFAEYRNLRNATIDAALNGNNEFHFNGRDYEMKTEDQNFAEDIRIKKTAALNYINNHPVQIWDNNKKDYVNAVDLQCKFASADDFVNMASYAHGTKSHIMNEPDYDAAIAEDKYSGVNSGATANKK